MDLFALVADKNVQYALFGAIGRHQALGIRPITFECATHSGRDGGVRTSGPEILALEARNHDACLLVLDFEGSGAEQGTAIELEQELDARLHELIGPRSKAIVCDPECDAWVWGSDNVLAPLLDWNQAEPIRDWVAAKGFELDGRRKPRRPKEAFEAVVKNVRLPRSASLYKQITSQISLARCTDAAYLRLQATLRQWFPSP